MILAPPKAISALGLSVDSATAAMPPPLSTSVRYVLGSNRAKVAFVLATRPPRFAADKAPLAPTAPNANRAG